MRKAIVIGAGFGGMSAAAYLAKAGYAVTVVEKNDQPGGRAMVSQADGFTWDLGPSWYMMPDVFEEFFADFGKKRSDYYTLVPLDPSYRVFDDHDDSIAIGNARATQDTFEALVPGTGRGLSKLLERTGREYATVRKEILTTDWLSPTQALRADVLKFLLNPEMIRSYDRRVSKYVPDARLKRILEFMTVFMGGSPQNIPGMYTLLTYVDMGLGIWYPMGGFGAVARGFQKLGEDMDVEYRFSTPVANISYADGIATGVTFETGEHLAADVVVANADYHHVETQLLGDDVRTVRESSWRKKTLSPSGLIICLGVQKRLPVLEHHNLFFDVDWDGHFDHVFTHKTWSGDPLFYLCMPSKTDKSVAPEGMENLFILAPQANGEQPDEATVSDTVASIITRIEHKIGISFAGDIVSRQVRAHDYFKTMFNAYDGNAFGLAHTLTQSAIFRPPVKSKKLSGLYFVGQYTNPGTGVPMVVLSGKTVAQTVVRHAK